MRGHEFSILDFVFQAAILFVPLFPIVLIAGLIYTTWKVINRKENWALVSLLGKSALISAIIAMSIVAIITILDRVIGYGQWIARFLDNFTL